MERIQEIEKRSPANRLFDIDPKRIYPCYCCHVNNEDNNIKKKGKLKTIVLLPNVNDYDTGEDNLT
jgi:hypothetical protein